MCMEVVFRGWRRCTQWTWPPVVSLVPLDISDHIAACPSSAVASCTLPALVNVFLSAASTTASPFSLGFPSPAYVRHSILATSGQHMNSGPTTLIIKQTVVECFSGAWLDGIRWWLPALLTNHPYVSTVLTLAGINDVLFLTEIWVQMGDCKELIELCPPGFRPTNSSRTHDRSGGLGGDA